MHDPYRPTASELEIWGEDPDAMYPSEDWDIIIESDELAPTFLRLASDLTYPARRCMLDFLHVYAWQKAAAARAAASHALWRQLGAASHVPLQDVQSWRRHTIELLMSSSSERIGSTAAG